MPTRPKLDLVKEYFEKRIRDHGASPRGADWNGAEAQTRRFDQLLKVVDGNDPFSILDYGCGYGALAGYLASLNYDFTYIGFDILKSAIETARQAHERKPQVTFTYRKDTLSACDYVVASGIFNFRADQPLEVWTEYTLGVLREMDKLSRRGFSSNFLTTYSDPHKMRHDLYYADPLFIFDYCKRHFSKNVALLHDYGMHDFTILVRKDV